MSSEYQPVHFKPETEHQCQTTPSVVYLGITWDSLPAVRSVTTSERPSVIPPVVVDAGRVLIKVDNDKNGHIYDRLHHLRAPIHT